MLLSAHAPRRLRGPLLALHTHCQSLRCPSEQEPFLAIVVDPHRTVAAGKVEIGAFRTYPEASGGAWRWRVVQGLG